MKSQTIASLNTALKVAIIERRITQRRLARRLRMDETRLSRIITRQVVPFPRERKALARALNVAEAALFPEQVAS